MNKSYLFAFFIFLLPLLCCHSTNAARIHGNIYEWYTLEPLYNVIVYVNSTPPQRFVATRGFYEFELEKGNYMLVAKYYEGNKLVYIYEENITIQSDGNFTIDIIMFPNIDLEEKIFKESDVNFSIEDVLWLQKREKIQEMRDLLLIFLGAILLFLFVFFLLRKTREKGQETSEELPDDLKEMVEIIKENGGRITQLELRKKLNYSEAKISLMLADLERRGLIEKFKRGKGNIIILKNL